MEGSGWGTHVYLWQTHFDIWQNQYNIVKLKNLKVFVKKKKFKNLKVIVKVKKGKNPLSLVMYLSKLRTLNIGKSKHSH